jgi:guanosine-3',5'-bis(diphosphate) 3'-pyrophosphohydrolase
MKDVLQHVIDFTAKAHDKQVRKYADEPFINHPLRVMETCKTVTNDVSILSAAVLHDVLEDTDVEHHELHRFLSSIMDQDNAHRTTSYVVELTDVYIKSAYPRWNRRTRKAKEADRIAATSAESQTIKYADILDNTSGIITEDLDFAKLFLYECRSLLRRIPNGDQQLYQLTVKNVQEKIDELKAMNLNPGIRE